ncbi:MAG: polyvinylalcohol dehydrogenase [Planctomycetes bacterium]|nr:polyvinylalcohol dehydrogenase [Planctomycetota bacterium]
MVRGFWLACAVAVAQLGAMAADWPHFRGPKCDGICTETGLLKEWPAEGPKLLWTATGAGKGYSSMSIVGGKLYTMGDLRGETGGDAQHIIAFDLETQKVLWTAKVGGPHGDGSRCTPTVDGGLVYAVGTDGNLVCVQAADGKEVWRKSFGSDFGGRMMSGWKYSESPLIDGDKLVCTPGGDKAAIVALNKKTGETIWKCEPLKPVGGAGYASIVVSEGAGVRQYITLFGRGALSAKADDGKCLWQYPRIGNGTANIPSPVVDGDHVFVSTAYGTGAALLKLSAADGGVKAEQVYFLDAKTFQNHHGGMVKVGDHIYAGSGHNAGAPTCIEMKTGKVVWQESQPGGGSGAALFADGNLIIRYQGKEVCLIGASPDGYKLKGKFTPPNKPGMGGPAWPHPVIADGKLYLRHSNYIFCYDVKGQ